MSCGIETVDRQTCWYQTDTPSSQYVSLFKHECLKRADFVCLFRNLFPENLIQACFQQVKTVYVPKEQTIIPPTESPVVANASGAVAVTVAALAEVANDSAVEMVRSLKYSDGMNVLGEWHTG